MRILVLEADMTGIDLVRNQFDVEELWRIFIFDWKTPNTIKECETPDLIFADLSSKEVVLFLESNSQIRDIPVISNNRKVIKQQMIYAFTLVDEANRRGRGLAKIIRKHLPF